MEKGLLEKTGKPLDHWIDIVKKSKIEKHKEIIDFMNITQNFGENLKHLSKDLILNVINLGPNYKDNDKENINPTHHLQFFDYWDENGTWEEIGPLTSSNNTKPVAPIVIDGSAHFFSASLSSDKYQLPSNGILTPVVLNNSIQSFES